MKYVTRLLTATALLAMGLISACTIDSADEFSRDVSVNFTGFYRGDGGGKIVANNSGASITTLDLRQTGDSLEAVDNNGAIWRGNLGEVQNGTSSFELNGNTSSGTEATFSGNISTSDGGSTGTTSSAEGSMQGTFIEPGRFSTFFATASIPGSVDTGGDNGSSSNSLSITPELTTLTSTTNATVSFTVSTADFTYKVEKSDLGSIISKNGVTLTYQQKGNKKGQNTVTVSSGSESDTATVSQQ